ncbi:MAG: type IV secretion system DNA-binding domain-containing protein [Phycisphaerae bacterium]|nr:type IV secretion system DNA-binding domain-containing protein [Phycisphaerae bacterium]
MSSSSPRRSSHDKQDDLAIGTPIGVCPDGKVRKPVCIPPAMRGRHVHLIGLPGTGKSMLMEAMILNDIQQGAGVAVIDPHGELVERLLHLVPDHQIERTICLSPGDPEWVPIWNPLRCGVNASPSRIAEELVLAFKSSGTACWTDRQEHLLRQAFFAVLHLPRGNLLDVLTLLRSESVRGRQLRSKLLDLIDNEVSQTFWREDFRYYRQADLGPAQLRLSKPLVSESVGTMLSQGDSAFSLHDVMDTSKILLLDLSHVDPQVRVTLGRVILSMLCLAGLGRRGEREHSRRPFHIYCDEAHEFLPDPIQDLIVEMYRSNVSLTLSHQCMDQFGARQADALAVVGSTIIFRVGVRDAEQFQKHLRGKASVEDLTSLGVGQAVARIRGHVVRIETQAPPAIPKYHHRDEIIARSRRLYCRPIDEVTQAIHRRNRRAE